MHDCFSSIKICDNSINFCTQQIIRLATKSTAFFCAKSAFYTAASVRFPCTAIKSLSRKTAYLPDQVFVQNLFSLLVVRGS